MSEPCEFCNDPATGPIARTPHGICERCACGECRGFRQYDDRGFLYSGSWPSLFFKECDACKGDGTREAQKSNLKGSKDT